MFRGGNHKDHDVSNDDVEIEAAENLLAKLKRQHRMMERNRRQYHDETTVILNRQRKMKFDLEQEKKKLEGELRFSSGPKNKVLDRKAKDSMSAILERQDEYETLIENEKERHKELDSVVAEMERDIRETRKKIPSTKTLDDELHQAKKSNTVLENRIQQSTVRLNAVLASNATLRGDIENQLKERDKLFLQARRLEAQLEKTSKKKSDVMDQVTKAYVEREEAQTKMKSLKDRIDRDSLKYTNEMKKIQRAIDFQTNLKSFVNTITAADDEENYRRRQEGEDGEESVVELTLEKYRQSLSHLEELGKTSSVEAIFSTYLQTENDNYTLFSYISDLSNEVASLTGDVNQLRQEIDSAQGKLAVAEEKNSKNIRQHNEELAKMKEEVRVMEDQERNGRACLVEVIAATSELIYLLECDSKSVQDLVGSTEVTSSNLPIFLSIIEQKIQEIAQMRDSISRGPGPPGPPDMSSDAHDICGMSDMTKIKANLPHFSHVIDEEMAKPLTHNDVLTKVDGSGQERETEIRE